MSHTREPTSYNRPEVEQLYLPGQFSVIPSWLISVVLHGALLFFFATSLKSCGQIPGAAEGEYRDVGIYIKDATDLIDEESVEKSDQSSELENNTSTFAPESNSPQDSTTEVIDDLLNLPTVAESNQTIGAGEIPTDPRRPVPGDVKKFFPPPGGTRQQSLKADSGEVDFFGAKDNGSRFVYLLDSSGSMTSHNAIREAKAELMASLGSLEATQQFQIVFYNSNSRTMMHGSGTSARKLYWATDINRTLARQFIAGIQPDGGTRHMPAIKKALRFNPQVIFFLTDADEPQLSAAELNEIKKMNRGRTHIHCIEFGMGSNLRVDNFLKKLARQNNGMYQYRDVTKFSR